MTDFLNYQYSYRRGDKYIFVPNADGIKKGENLLRFIERNVDFPKSFYHFAKGGHVTALHKHLDHKEFFRIDLQRYFYSIGRNRVARSLHAIGFGKARTYAKWSCVKNPYDGPRYALPIGFLQSPMLASLAFMHSPFLEVIESARLDGVFISVYLDDIVGSANDKVRLSTVFERLCSACVAGSFVINEGKLQPPSDRIQAFNCDLEEGLVNVTEARMSKFEASSPSLAGRAAFVAYCERVAANNICCWSG